MKNKFLSILFVSLSLLFHSKLFGQCSASITASTTSVCSGQPVTITVTTFNCGSNLQFLWNTGDNVQSFTDTLVNISSAPVAITYSVTVTYSGGTATATKQLIVYPIPVLTITNNAPVICNGDITNVLLSSATSGTSYSWTAVVNNLTGASNGAGSTIGQILTNSTDSNGTAIYTVTPNYNGCVGASQSTAVTVNQRPVITVTNNTATICSGQRTDIQLSSDLPGSTFQWTPTEFDATGSSSGNGSLIEDSLTSTVNGTGSVSYSVIATHDGCQGFATQTTVMVKPVPNLVFSTMNPGICNGDSVLITLSSIFPDATFEWIASSSNVNGASNGSGNTINQGLTAGNPPATVTYSVTATLDGCEAVPLLNTVLIKRRPSASYSPINPIICSGSSPNVHLTSSPFGASFSWYPSATNITGASSGNGNTLNQLLTNTGNLTESVIYNVTPELNGCSGSVLQVPIIVKPLPVVLINQDTSSICSGNSTNIQLTSNPGGALLNWTAVAVNVNGYSNGTGNTISQLLSTTSTSGTVNYTITPSLNQCQGSSSEAIVFVNTCTLGIETNSGSENFIVLSPNPSSQECRLTLPVSKPCKVTLEIYNNLGTKMFASIPQQVDYLFEQSINTSSFQKGVYTIVVFTEHAKFTKCLVVIN